MCKLRSNNSLIRSQIFLGSLKIACVVFVVLQTGCAGRFKLPSLNDFHSPVTFFDDGVRLDSAANPPELSPQGFGAPGFNAPAVVDDPNRPLSNPLTIGDTDPEFLWNQMVDTLDDYFRIDLEQRMIRSGSQWVEGEIVTFPEISASYLEPWRKDTAFGFQRLQSTLQSIRRTARARIVPELTGYTISVEVTKDLEDVDRSQSSPSGAATLRHDGTVARTNASLAGQPITIGWIEQERDNELEQKILREFLGRINNVKPPRKRFLYP